jgi:hypothetical protein
MEALILILLLQIKHCYADFRLQTYMQTVKKGVWLHPIGISHSVDHAWCSLVAILIFSLWWTISLPLAILVVSIEAVLHYIIDFTKVKYGSKDQTKPIFWTQFGLDQLAHQLTYIAIIWYIIL